MPFPRTVADIQDPGLLRDRILRGFTLTQLLARGSDQGIAVGQLAYAESDEGVLVCHAVTSSTSTWKATVVEKSLEYRGASVSASLRALAVAWDSEIESGTFDAADHKWYPGYDWLVEGFKVRTDTAGGGSGTVGVHLDGSFTPADTPTTYTPGAADDGVFAYLDQPVQVTAPQSIGFGTTFAAVPGTVLAHFYGRRLFLPA